MEKEITALKAQVKNPNRISVFLDGEFAFGLARIVAAWLKIGQRLTEAEITRLKDQDSVETAYQKALHFLSYRARSEMEVQRRLSEQGYDEDAIRLILERLKENGYVGDKEFARVWVENRSTFRPRSKRMLAVELRQKGVEDEVIEQALAETVDESSLAYQTAQKYARRLSGVDWDTFRKRLGAYLMRRGFSYGTIGPILRQVWEETRAAGADSSNLTEDEDG